MKLKLSLLLVFSIVCFPLLITGCKAQEPNVLNVDDEGNTNVETSSLEEWLGEQTHPTLDATEREGLLFMREEEKLARDVYKELYSLWGVNSFNNIGNSEQTHMNAMKSLLDAYGLADPAQGMDYGEFSDDTLQTLCNDLVALGAISEIEALKVGAAIEEIDILDIVEYKNQTDNEDIIFVYDNLLKGSRNHLRAFVSIMESRGYSYTPQYITQEQFDEIINGQIETGSN